MSLFSLFEVSFEQTVNPTLWELYSVHDVKLNHYVHSDEIDRFENTAAINMN